MRTIIQLNNKIEIYDCGRWYYPCSELPKTFTYTVEGLATPKGRICGMESHLCDWRFIFGLRLYAERRLYGR